MPDNILIKSFLYLMRLRHLQRVNTLFMPFGFLLGINKRIADIYTLITYINIRAGNQLPDFRRTFSAE
jgi:hypothetical protein